jgi:hypothetical protein
VTDAYVRHLVRDLRQYGILTFLVSHPWRVVADLLDELLTLRERGRYRRAVELCYRSDN